MSRSLTFLYLLVVSSHVITLPEVECQSSNWMVLDENSEKGDSFRSAGLFDLRSIGSVPSNLTAPCNQTKDERFCNCEARICLEPDEYVMVNETAHVEAYNTSYNSSFYEIEGDCLKICAPDFIYSKTGEGEQSWSGKYSKTLTYITIVGLAISMLCLVLHLIAFVLVRDMRNIPGYCMACLCVSLLAGYISFLVGFDDYILISGGPCVATASSAHFFLLSSVLWMNVMAFDVLKSLMNAAGKLRVKSTSFSFKNFYGYCLYSWGIALLFAIIAVVSDKLPCFPEEYRPHFSQGLCWFKQKKALLVFFALPVFVVICLNVLFFGLSAYTLISNKMKAQHDPHRGMLKRNLVIYIRLAVIMGLTWVAGFLAGIIDAVFLWYIFAILNTLQGFFIFLAFTCTPKVKNHFASSRFTRQTIYPNFHNSNGTSTSNVTVTGKT